MSGALACSELWKLYDLGDEPVEAVRGVNLSIKSGEMVAIMGPSGCGKTTLLNILCGIDDPSAGIVTVSGKLLYGISDDERTGLRAKHMGFIFQQFNLLPVLTALENVELPLLVGKVDAAKARIKARKALDSVGLGDRYDHRPAELSGGQQQRVAVARAFVHSPDVILCDEPTGNLDSRTSTEIMDLLMALNRDEGVTLVIVTHDEEIAARCHRILHMSDGMMVTEEG
jgi:ABC-type lipoprotein export system ATPase subunit|tara:strand:- start:236 stop:919 length:684 start_codon:yes stop_codon:yes gene_type:complete